MGTDRKITIITPVFNAEKDIEACILSVAGQSYPDKEHLLVDGASTDGTLEIIKRYAEKYSHIKLISEKDDGIYDAMNKGIDLASGEWIYFLGCDDVFYDDMVLVNIFSSDEIDSLDLVYGNVFWGDTGEIYDGKFSRLKLMEKNLCHQSVFYRRTLFEKLGKFDTEYKSWADYLFNIKCFNSVNVRLKYVDIVVAKYGAEGFSSATPDEDFIKNRQVIFQEHFPVEYVENYSCILGLKRSLHEQHCLLVEQNMALDQRQQQIDRLNIQLASLYNSASWRLTTPLRKLIDKVFGRNNKSGRRSIG